MSYSKFINFGSSTNNNIKNPNNPSNPLTYCLMDTSSVQFLHGSTSRFYSPQCYECQNYMALRCAGKYDENETWDKYCEFYRTMNTDTYWPNQAAVDEIPAVIIEMCGRLSQGDILLRNSVERRFLDFPNCQKTYIQFDPNVANSPYIEKVDGCSCNYSEAIVRINPSTIDNDPLMNKAIENCKIVADVLAVIYKKTVLEGNLSLANTRLGSHFSKYADFYNYVLKMIERGNPLKLSMGLNTEIPQQIQNNYAGCSGNKMGCSKNGYVKNISDRVVPAFE